MKIDYEFKKSHLIFNFIPDIDDKLEYINRSNNRIIKFNNKTCCFLLPDKCKIIHNDLICVASILLILPFVNKTIEFLFPISNHIIAVFKKFKLKIISPIKKINFRNLDSVSNPSLAYSGGTDSTAALLLLPKNTKVIFADRIIKLDNKGIYNKDSIYYVLDNLISINYDITVVKTDMEYIRLPIGFPTDLACSIPNILLADYHNIDNITYGYCNHHAEFLNNDIEYICTGDLQLINDNPKFIYENSNFWKELFGAISLGLNFNTMGLTEVATTLLINKSPLQNIVSSCIRGNINSRCNRCFKCFKTSAMEIFLKKKYFDENDLNLLMDIIKDEIKKPRYGNINIDQIDNIKKIEAFLIFISYYYKEVNNQNPINPINKTLSRIIKKYSKYHKNFHKNMKWNPESLKYCDINYQRNFKKKIKEVNNIIENELV